MNRSIQDMHSVLNTKEIMASIKSFYETTNIEGFIIFDDEDSSNRNLLIPFVSEYEGEYYKQVCYTFQKLIDYPGICFIKSDVKICKDNYIVAKMYYFDNTTDAYHINEFYHNVELLFQKNEADLIDFFKRIKTVDNKEIKNMQGYLDIFAKFISRVATQQLILNVVQDIGNQISTSMDIKRVVGPFIQNIKRLVNYDVCCIWLMDNDKYLVPCDDEFSNSDGDYESMLDEFYNSKIKIGKNLVGKIALDNKQKILNTCEEIQREFPKYRESIILKNMNSYLGIPISFDNVIMGVIEIASKSPNSYDYEDYSMINSLSSQAGAYIRNFKITNTLTQLVTDGDEMYEYVNFIVDRILNIINAKTCSIYIREEADIGPAYLVATNGQLKNNSLSTAMFNDPEIKNKAMYHANEGITGWVMENMKSICLPAAPNLEQRNIDIASLNSSLKLIPQIAGINKYDENSDGQINSEGYGAYLCVPIIVDKKEEKNTYGVIKLIGKSEKSLITNEFTNDEKKILETCANCIGKALEIKYAENRLIKVVSALAAAIDAKDPYTVKHSRNVQMLSERIGIKMGLPKKQINELRMAALLHDIGKIGIPDSVLSKPGLYNQAEKLMITIHPILGASFIEEIKGLENIASGIRDHHEYYDGKDGYPRLKSGKDISLYGRIIAVADCFDAIRADRPYKKSVGLDETFKILREKSNKQFDPDILDIFIKEFGAIQEIYK